MEPPQHGLKRAALPRSVSAVVVKNKNQPRLTSVGDKKLNLSQTYCTNIGGVSTIEGGGVGIKASAGGGACTSKSAGGGSGTTGRAKGGTSGMGTLTTARGGMSTTASAAGRMCTSTRLGGGTGTKTSIGEGTGTVKRRVVQLARDGLQHKSSTFNFFTFNYCYLVVMFSLVLRIKYSFEKLLYFWLRYLLCFF